MITKANAVDKFTVPLRSFDLDVGNINFGGLDVFAVYMCRYRWRGFDLDVGNINFGGLDVFAVYTCTVGAVSIWTSATSILAV